MSREFLGWYWDTDAGKRGAYFFNPKIGGYVCHYSDGLPCSNLDCQPKPLPQKTVNRMTVFELRRAGYEVSVVKK